MSVFTRGSTALITGGASGIGLAIAKLCRAKGMNLVLVDRNADALDAARSQLGGDDDKSSVAVYTMDVSRSEEWTTLKDEVLRTVGAVELLVLNAGTAMKGTWGDDEYFAKTIETNLFGIIHGIGAFLPVVQKSADAKPTSIVITGSKQGITNPPGNPAYNASKAAVKSLAEQLSFDLRGTTTTVHLLVPGWTFTPLAGAGHFKEKPAAAWTPEQVAEYLQGKMGEGVFYVLCPDNEVTEEMDRKRVLWSAGDLVHGRPPLSRWREDWKDKAAEGIDKMEV